jgi:hypothetical protein
MDINFAIHQYLYSPDGTPDNSYHGGEALWAKVKFAQQLGRPMIALFCTYGYRAAYRNNRQSVISPIRIQGSWSLEELRYTREEYDTVVQMLYQVDFIGTLVPDELTDLSDHVWDMTLGHPGLVAFTFRNIYRHFREFQRRDITSPKPVTFIEIFDYTKSNLFYLALEAVSMQEKSLHFSESVADKTGFLRTHGLYNPWTNLLPMNKISVTESSEIQVKRHWTRIAKSLNN